MCCVSAVLMHLYMYVSLFVLVQMLLYSALAANMNDDDMNGVRTVCTII